MSDQPAMEQDNNKLPLSWSDYKHILFVFLFATPVVRDRSWAGSVVQPSQTDDGPGLDVSTWQPGPPTGVLPEIPHGGLEGEDCLPGEAAGLQTHTLTGRPVVDSSL